MLDFADRTGCGIFMVLWPQMQTWGVHQVMYTSEGHTAQ